MKKAKCKIVSIALYPLRIAEEGHLRKHSSIGLSVQKEYRKDEPETKETGSLQRWVVKVWKGWGNGNGMR